MWRALEAYGKVSTPPILTPQGVNHRYAVQMEGERKRWQAVWNTVGTGSEAHIKPQVSIAFSIRDTLASCTLKQTRHSQRLCFGVMWRVTSKHWQRADTAKTHILLVHIRPNNDTDLLSSPPKLAVTFRMNFCCSFAVFNYTAYSIR